MTLKRTAVAAMMTLVPSLVALAATSAPASAADCIIDISYNGNTAAVRCASVPAGSSQYRVEFNCTNASNRLGPWRNAGSGIYSSAGCPTGGVITSSGGRYQVYIGYR